MVPISSVMNTDLILVDWNTPLAECLHLLMKHGLRHLPVVDEHGSLLGMVHDYHVFSPSGVVWDSARVCVRTDPERSCLPALNVASTSAPTVCVDTPMLSVLAAFERGKDAVVVVDSERKPLGIFTEQDALHLAAQYLPDHLLVHAIATPRPLRVPARTSVTEALAILREQGIRHLMVTERGELVAVVSHRDLVAASLDDPDRTLGVLHRDCRVRAAAPNAPARDAAAVMVRHKIGCLPLVDGQGRLTAVLTRSDVVRALGGLLRRTSAAIA